MKNEIERRRADLKCDVNVFNILVDSNPAEKLVEYFKEKNKKSGEHEQCNMQSQMMEILSQSHGNNSFSVISEDFNFGYGYPMTPHHNISQSNNPLQGKYKYSNHGSSKTQLIYFHSSGLSAV